jgi:hypothetical protein
LQQQRPAAPAPQRPLSGYRRPEPAPSTGGDETTTTGLGGELPGRARPTIEGSEYEAVLADDHQAPPLGSEVSPFARLEAEQAASKAEPDAPAFRSEPQKLIAPQGSDTPKDEDEPGEVDRVMLAKEFSGLLQVGEDGDED